MAAGSAQNSQFSPNAPLLAKSQHCEFALLVDFEKKDVKYKRRIRVLRFVSRVNSIILNAFMIGTLSFALAKYFLTRNRIIAGNVHPWVTPTTLWPTFMLLAISTITFFMNLITLCTYICGVGAANKASSFMSVLGYILLGVHVIVWAVSTGLFRMARTGHDLWGYSCSDQADAIQKEVESYLDFGKLCSMQQGAWYASIIETIAYLLTFITVVFMMKRVSYRKKMVKVRESLAGYTQNVELETVSEPETGVRNYMPVAAEPPHFRWS